MENFFVLGSPPLADTKLNRIAAPRARREVGIREVSRQVLEESVLFIEEYMHTRVVGFHTWGTKRAMWRSSPVSPHAFSFHTLPHPKLFHNSAA
jgi:hypothetical protein